MLYPVLTYSRNLGDFSPDLAQLHSCGLKAIRLIYKGKTENEFNLRIEEIQKEINRTKINIDILIDLPGSKPTVGNLGKGLLVNSGEEYHLIGEETKSSSTIIPTINFFNHTSFSNLSKGDIISLADDQLNLLVKEIREDVVICEALNSYNLASNRSLSVKSNPFSFEANSERDLHFVRNLKHLQPNIKLIVSFAKKSSDLKTIKALRPELEVIPKVESVVDDKNLLEILECCETVLLGRGDLSTAHQPNEIFKFQKHLIELCRTHNKKIIVGTGLLTGMSEMQGPSIAEVMDYGYLRSMGVEAFLLSSSNSNNQTQRTIEFMNEFEL